MKKMIISCFAAVFMCIFGCKSLPTADKIVGLSYSAGLAAGYVCEITNTDAATVETTIAVMNVVQTIIPGTNSTCVAAWKPVITENVGKFVAEGKIDAAKGAIIITSLTLVAEAVDYVFIKHPDWKQYADATTLAVNGVCEGFKSVACASAFKGSLYITYDSDAYIHLRAIKEFMKPKN